MEWNQLVLYTLLLLGGALVGYLFATRHARRMKKRVVQQMNAQSLELLDAKASINQLKEHAASQSRKDNLLKLTLTRLQKTNRTIGLLQRHKEASDKKHFRELSHMRMRAVEARETARKAAAIAGKAMLHLKRLEKVSPVTQTIEAPEPKSYGKSEPVTVSVVDQARLDGSAEAVAQVSNRDSARLTKLRSSNEATAT